MTNKFLDLQGLSQQIARQSSKFTEIDEGKVSEPEAEGTQGQVLTTDGNGGRIWTTVSSGEGGGGTSDYNSLFNKPKINGVNIIGDLSSSDLGIVSENTTSGWDAVPDYTPKAGEICYYSDTGKLKIGDGLAYIADLPFLSDTQIQPALDALQAHIDNTSVHVTTDDRNTWNAKVSCDVIGEDLIFSRS